jgi:hypothetical protein
MLANAYLMIRALGRPGYPPEPTGPTELHGCLAAMRELRAWADGTLAASAAEPAGPTSVPAAEPPANKKSLKEPPPEAFAAYRLSRGTGAPQQTIAKTLSEEFRRPISQGTVSRWLGDVKDWLEAGNVLPPLPEPVKRKPMSMDPERIDLGPHWERRARHQRRPRSSDND